MKHKLLNKLLVLMLLTWGGAIFSPIGAEVKTLTFQQTSTSAGTLSGDVPSGVTASFLNTYSGNKEQITNGNTMTLTLSGWSTTTTIKGVNLRVKNNASSGNGTATVTIGTTTLGTLTITGLGSSYQIKSLTITETMTTDDLVITIECPSGKSNNSVYCDRFVISYEEAYTVSYDANGGTGSMTDSNSPYVEGATVTLLNNAFTAPDNKTFNEWAVTDASGNAVTVSNNQFTMPASNVTVTAQWTDAGGTTTYSVTYNANGADSGTPPTDSNSPYDSGSTVTILGQGTLAKTGNAFSGWNTQADGLGTNYSEGNTFNITANTTLYAKWTPYTITEQSNNDSYGTVSREGNVITGHPADGCRYASPAYTVAPANSATVEQNGNEFTVTPTANTTVTINFEAIPTHTVTFSVNGTTVNTDVVAEGAAITFPSNPAAISGKSFVGWLKNSTISGTTNETPSIVNKSTETMGNSDVTYYAVFADATIVGDDTYEKLSSNSFDATAKYVIAATQASNENTMWYLSSYSGVDTNVSWGVMTSSPSTDAPIEFSLSGTASSLVAKDGDGNYLAGLETGRFKMSSTSVSVALDSDGKIKNSSSGSYYLRHNYNGGSGGLRWYSSSTGTSAYFYKVIPGVTYSNYCTSVVVTYSVTYDANGATSGDVPTDATAYSSGATVTVLGNTGNLAKTGYTFGGWNTQTDGNGTNYAANETFSITANTTLYAKWNEKTITGLSYTGTPTTTTYSAGESFDPTGLTVTATYNDASQENVTASVTWTPDPLTVGTTSVTGTYMERTVNVSGLTVTAAAGSADNPYTVAQAIYAINNSGTVNGVYVKGIISQIDSYNSTYNSLTYWISDDGTTTSQFEVYSGLGINGAAFSSTSDLAVGDEVVVTGDIKKYNSVYEFNYNNELVSLKLVAPTFSVAAGAVASGTTVTISDAHTGSTIYYTTDGTDPTESSSEYSAPISITTATTLKAIAVKSGYTTSDVASAEYTIAAPVATPYFSLAAGTFTSEQDVEISCDTQEATIYYTTNGDVPTTASTEYTAAIHLSETTTIKAIAVKDGMADSEVAEATFTINLPKVTLSTNSVEVDAAGGSGTITVTYENFTLDEAEVVFYESDGETTASYDHSWITATLNASNNLEYSIGTNSGDARTAYIRVYALDDEANEYTSELITFTQAAPAEYVALVAQYDGKFYAVDGSTFSSGTYGAVEVDAVNGKVITNATDDITFELTTSGETQTIQNKATSKYIGYGTSGTELKQQDDAYYWTIDETNASWVNSYSRSIVYRATADGFKAYATGNINTSDYASYTTAYTFADGYTREVTAGNYGTICLPYNVAADDFSGVKFYSISGKKMDGTTLEYVTLQEETSLVGGAAYIFKANEEATKLVAAYSGLEQAEPIGADVSDTGLTGTYSKQYIPVGKYVLKNGTIYYVDQANYVYSGANKAYIDLTDVPDVSASAVKGICLFGEDFETGIMSVGGSQEFNEIYNLSGQRIQKMQKGINIVNGKKILK